MILETVKGSENVPEGGIRLTKEEAISHQRKIVENWPVLSEVFFLRFGNYITAAATAVCSVTCINIFHPVLKFGRGTFTAVLPSALLPPAFLLYKTQNLTDDVITLKMDCPLCLHMKFLALTLYGGLVFPGLMGLLSATEGQGVPNVQIDGRDYWRRTMKIAQAKSGTFRNLFFFQVCLAFFMPYAQHFQIAELMKKLSKNQIPEVSGEILQV